MYHTMVEVTGWARTQVQNLTVGNLIADRDGIEYAITAIEKVSPAFTKISFEPTDSALVWMTVKRGVQSRRMKNSSYVFARA